jgi:hypothetical protein
MGASYGEREKETVELHTFLISALGADECLASCSDHFITGKKIAVDIEQGDGWCPVPIWEL